jgi:hypothetical protein
MDFPLLPVAELKRAFLAQGRPGIITAIVGALRTALGSARALGSGKSALVMLLIPTYIYVMRIYDRISAIWMIKLTFLIL